MDTKEKNGKAEIISTTPTTTPAPVTAASENPTPAPDSATPASTAPEKTGKVETPAPANADQPDTAVDVRRQRVEELKKSLTSGSGSVATPAPATTNETPTPGTSNITAEIGTDTSEAPAEIISETPEEIISETPEKIISETPEEIISEAPEEIISETPASTTTSEVPPPPATIPCNYLAGGYYRGEGNGRYPNPALVDQAEVIGKALAAGGVTPTAINRMIRTLKDAKKLPFDAQQGAMKKLLPLALKEKKPLLREVVEHNRAAVKNEADFAACIDHFKDISIFLAANGVKK